MWYLPAVLLGVPVAWGLRRLGWKGGLAAAGALYLLGLMGGQLLRLRGPGAISEGLL